MPEPPLLVVHGAQRGDVAVSLERLLVSRLVITASPGGGKSWALRYLLEQTQKDIQQFVLDPEGEFATLRERHPYLLVGKQGELPAIPAQAHVLARRLMALGSSAILDLSDLRTQDRHEFVRNFAQGLLDMPQKEWHSVLVVLDEAHLYAPEAGRGESVALAAVNDLANLGRKRGQCLVIASQRLANVHNNVLAVMQNKLIGLTTLDTDVRRAMQDLGFSTREQRRSLALLDPGHFYALGTAICREPTLVRTGNVLTTHPRPGMVQPPAPPAPAAIQALAAQLQDLGTAAAQDLDLEGARARIAELERKLADRQGEPVGPSPARLAALERELADALGKIELMEVGRDRRLEFMRSALQSLTTSIDGLRRLRSQFSEIVSATYTGVDTSTQPDALIVNGQPTPFSPPLPADTRTVESGQRHGKTAAAKEWADRNGATIVGATGVERAATLHAPARVLAALGRLAELGVEQPEKAAVAAFAGYLPTKAHFTNLLGNLRTRGLVDYPTKTAVMLTPEGKPMARRLAHQAPSQLALQDLHAMWVGELGGTFGKILQVLLESRQPMNPEEIKQRIGWTAGHGHFMNQLGRLHSMGIVVKTPDGEIAHPSLFPDLPDLTQR